MTILVPVLYKMANKHYNVLYYNCIEKHFKKIDLYYRLQVSFDCAAKLCMLSTIVCIKNYLFTNVFFLSLGLLDVPICAVNDDGYFANPKYSLQFPPNTFNKEKLAGNQRIPVNAINVNSQLHPINTVTGLQYFTGLNSYPWREKAVPKVGLGEFN